MRLEAVNFLLTFIFSGTPNDKFQKVQYDGFVRKEPVADWDACYKIIVKVIESKGVIKSRDLNRQITVFSYFTERAAEAGLVGKNICKWLSFLELHCIHSYLNGTIAQL